MTHSIHTPVLGEIREALAQGSVDTLADIALHLYGMLVAGEMKKRVPKDHSVSNRATWLTPIMVEYEAEMGAGSFATLFGVAAKTLTGLHKAGHSPEVIARRLGYYLRTMKRTGKTPFISLPKFATTFNEWQGDGPAFDDEPL